MQTCYNCGRQVEDNVLICPDCGALVRRYDRPERPEETDLSVRDAEPARKSGRYVVLDGRNKLRLRGFLKVLCVISVILNAYFAFSQFLVLWLSSAGEFFSNMLSEYSAFGIDQAVIDMLRLTVEYVGQNRTGILLIGSLFLIKAACLVWFQVTKRKLSLWAAGAAAVLLVLVFVFTGGGFSALEYMLDLLLIFLLVMRQDWMILPR